MTWAVAASQAASVRGWVTDDMRRRLGMQNGFPDHLQGAALHGCTLPARKLLANGVERQALDYKRCAALPPISMLPGGMLEGCAQVVNRVSKPDTIRLLLVRELAAVAW